MLKYYEQYVKKCKYFERTTIAELLYMAEWSQRNNLKRADKILQNSKRRIIFSTKSGIFWNSDAMHFDQFLSGIKEKYNMDLFMDTLLEIKRVHASTATDLAQNLLRLIRDFYLFEDDRNLIADLQYDVMMAGSSEKANIRDAMAKSNIKNDRPYPVDLEIFCDNNITNYACLSRPKLKIRLFKRENIQLFDYSIILILIYPNIRISKYLYRIIYLFLFKENFKFIVHI